MLFPPDAQAQRRLGRRPHPAAGVGAARGVGFASSGNVPLLAFSTPGCWLAVCLPPAGHSPQPPNFPSSCPFAGLTPCPPAQALHALEAGTVAALPDAVRVELEAVQDGGGVQHLQEVSTQIRVRCCRHCVCLRGCRYGTTTTRLAFSSARGDHPFLTPGRSCAAPVLKSWMPLRRSCSRRRRRTATCGGPPLLSSRPPCSTPVEGFQASCPLGSPASLERPLTPG